MAPAPAPVPAPLADFKRLGSSTYLYDPPINGILSSSSSSASEGPDLVLITTWLDAAPRHIAKYTRGYQAIFPRARILLITTAVPDMIMHTERAEAERMGPAVQLMASLESPTTVLLHAFSNGGAYTAYLLARQYRATTVSSTTTTTASARALPVTAQILDSAPGRAQYGRAAAALGASLPRSPSMLRYLGWLAVHLFLVVYFFTAWVMARQDVTQTVRDGLLDTRLWDNAVPRAYIYTREDAIVFWRDVLAHAAEAKAKGWKRIMVEEFVGSTHCGHLTVDAVRYWDIVKSVWEAR